MFVISRFPKDIQEHLFVAVAMDGGLVEGGAEQLAGGVFFVKFWYEREKATILHVLLFLEENES